MIDSEEGENVKMFFNNFEKHEKNQKTLNKTPLGK